MIEQKAGNVVNVDDKDRYRLGLGVAEFFLERKQGPYLDVDFLVATCYDSGNTLAIRDWARRAIFDIGRDGEDSIANLCLTMGARDSLFRVNLTKISDLREFLETGEWRWRGKIRNFGAKSKEMAQARIASFDAEVAKLQG